MTIANPTISCRTDLTDVPAPMTNVAEYGFEGRFRRVGRRRPLFRVLQGRQPDWLGARAAGADRPVRARALPGPADRRGAVGSVQGAGYHAGGDQPGAVGQLPAHPCRRADRHQPERHQPAVLRAVRAGLCGYQRPPGRVGERRLFDPARRIPLGVLRRRRGGHVLGARRTAAALSGRRRDPSPDSGPPSSAAPTPSPSSRTSPPARAPTTRAGSASCWPTPTRNRR